MKVVRALNIFFGVAFVLAAAVQLNDPDPIRWVVLYLLGATCAIAFHRRRLDWRVSSGVAVIAILWGLTLVPTVVRHPPPLKDVFGDVKMYGPGVEEARESGGLFLVGSWLLVLAIYSRRDKA